MECCSIYIIEVSVYINYVVFGEIKCRNLLVSSIKRFIIFKSVN